jgi:glycosyltransferase involved in cell wall biosynthesis
MTISQDLQQKHRLLLVATQPTQNPRPLQVLAQSPYLDILMTYCSLPDDTKLWQGLEYLNKGVFDIPMLEGYPWQYAPNRSPRPSLGQFWGLINPVLLKLPAEFDCCIVHGHSYASFWFTIIAAKLYGKPVLLTTDATYLDPLAGASWKMKLKHYLLPLLYNKVVDGVLVPSTASKRFLQSLGVKEERIFITPYVVDNETIARTAQQTDRQQIRADWQIPRDGKVVVFCAKFIPRKCPQDLLKAFARANVPDSYLVLVGDGPLKAELEAEVQNLGIADRVRFLGFVSYSRLPEVYASSDLLVHPAEWEPYGLPVNEAMICGVPVIVSDRVGAGYDLVQEGVTGFTYPCGNVESLANLLQKTLNDPELLKQMGKGAIERMQTWSSHENVAALIQAVSHVMACKQA